jgi:hypothetical protein
MKVPRLNRWDAVWAAGVVAVFLSFGIASGTPFYALFRVLFGAALVLLAVSDWRDHGHAWLPTLSWTVPFGALWLACLWLFEGRIALVFGIGAAVLLVMMVSTRAAVWWYQTVLRRPFKT